MLGDWHAKSRWGTLAWRSGSVSEWQNIDIGISCIQRASPPHGVFLYRSNTCLCFFQSSTYHLCVPPLCHACPLSLSHPTRRLLPKSHIWTSLLSLTFAPIPFPHTVFIPGIWPGDLPGAGRHAAHSAFTPYGWRIKETRPYTVRHG